MSPARRSPPPSAAPTGAPATANGDIETTFALLDRRGEVEHVSANEHRWMADARFLAALRRATVRAARDPRPQQRVALVNAGGRRLDVRLHRLMGATDDDRFLAICTETADEAPRGTSSPPLTAAQRRVAELLVTGATLGQIAQTLGIRPETAKSHTKAIYSRLEVRNRVELSRAWRP